MTSRVYEAEYISCQKAMNKLIYGQKTRKSLVQCQELQAETSIRNAAVKNMDGRSVTIVSRDLVAAEGYYRRLCYRSYTRKEKAARSATCDEDHNDEAQYKKARSHSQ